MPALNHTELVQYALVGNRRVELHAGKAAQDFNLGFTIQVRQLDGSLVATYEWHNERMEPVIPSGGRMRQLDDRDDLRKRVPRPVEQYVRALGLGFVRGRQYEQEQRHA